MTPLTGVTLIPSLALFFFHCTWPSRCLLEGQLWAVCPISALEQCLAHRKHSVNMWKVWRREEERISDGRARIQISQAGGRRAGEEAQPAEPNCLGLYLNLLQANCATWASYLTSLCLSFSICLMRMAMQPLVHVGLSKLEGSEQCLMYNKHAWWRHATPPPPKWPSWLQI
jgi:hypothetical protein